MTKMMLVSAVMLANLFDWYISDEEDKCTKE